MKAKMYELCDELNEIRRQYNYKRNKLNELQNILEISKKPDNFIAKEALELMEDLKVLIEKDEKIGNVYNDLVRKLNDSNRL